MSTTLFPDVSSSSQPLTLECQRAAFSLPPESHYINCAYMAPMSHAVEAAGLQGLMRQRIPMTVDPSEFFTVPNRLRAAFAQLVNASSADHIALVPSVSYGMAIAATNMTARVGQNVVMIGGEFPSEVLPWRHFANAHGLEIRAVAPPNDVALVGGASRGALWNEALHEAIDSSTAVVVLAHNHWSDGTRFDVASLARRARQFGAAVVMDGTQSVGALPFDIAEVQPDLLVCAGYKWLTGGYGLGVAYVGPRFMNGQPIEDNWTSQAGSDDFASLADYRDEYRATAERFDGGGRAHFILAPMLTAAIDQLLSWGVDNIQHYCADLMRPWLERADEYGLVVESDERYRCGHLVGLRFSTSRDLKVLARNLAANKVYVAVRGDSIRVSPHVYNNEEDVAALFASL